MRASIRAQVERCAYVENVDAQQAREPSATFDSFRKYKWLQRKALGDHAVSADVLDISEEDGDGEVVIDESDTSSAARKEQLVVFGGRVRQDVSMLLPAAVLKDPMKFERVRYTYSNGVYAYDIGTGVWRFHECAGRAPRERSDHSAVFLEPYFLVICGGRGRNGQIFRDTFALDVRSWQWTLVDTETQIVERYWHGCCVTRESVVVFGGKSDVVTHGDLQLLDVLKLRNHLLSVFDSTSSLVGSTETAPATDAKRTVTQDRSLSPAWTCPSTVGRPPSPRFGMAVVALDSERVAVIGGHKARKNKTKSKPGPRRMDVYILDTVTLIWSSPRLSSHVSMQTAAPTERMLFECFCYRNTLVVFGGFTYATNGESESCILHVDSDDPVVFKLDVNRMIWRRQVLAAHKGTEATGLPAAHIHASANAVLGTRAYTCAVSDQHALLELVDFRLEGVDLDEKRSRSR